MAMLKFCKIREILTKSYVNPIQLLFDKLIFKPYSHFTTNHLLAFENKFDSNWLRNLEWRNLISASVRLLMVLLEVKVGEVAINTMEVTLIIHIPLPAANIDS